MAERRPLVLVGGKVKELPVGDDVVGILFKIVSGLWQANPLSQAYVAGKEKIVINGANFISDGGDAAWSGFPNGYGRYNLYIGQEAADSIVQLGTFDVNTGVGYAALKSSENITFMTALGGGAGRLLKRDAAPETGSADTGGVVIGTNAGRNIPLFNASVLVGDAAGENINRILRSTLIGNKSFRPSSGTRYLWKVTALGSYVGSSAANGTFEHIIAIGHETLLAAPSTKNSIFIGDYSGQSRGGDDSIFIGHYRLKGGSIVSIDASFKNNIISIGHFIVPQQIKTINFPSDYRLTLGEVTVGTAKLTAIQKAADGDTASFVARNEADPVLSVVGDNVRLNKKLSKPYLATDADGNIVEASSPSTAPAGSTTQVQFNNAGVFGADALLSWDNTNKRLGIGETTPTARVHIKGVGTTSGTEAFRVTNSSNNLSLQIFDDRTSTFGGKVTATEFSIVNRLTIVGGSYPFIAQGINSTFNTTVTNGIVIASDSTFTVSSGSQRTFAFGRYLTFATGGGNYNTWIFGSGLSGNLLTGVHNHIIFGVGSNLPTFIISPASGVGTTGSAALGVGTNYGSSTWIVKGKITGTDPVNDRVQHGSSGTYTALLIRRTDGLANGTFWNRVTIGSLIEVNSIKTFVTSTAANTVNVTRAVTVVGTTLYPITLFPSIATWLKQDGSFGANLNYYGNFVVGENADNNESSAVQINSTTKGFLPPRMTGTQVEAIVSPAEGLMVYATNAGVGDINAKGWWGYDGTTWVQLN
jgi:hypothetical protein